MGCGSRGTADWPDDVGAPPEALDSGVACVLLAAPDGHNRASVCGYLVDTWCLGVKNAFGPRRMSSADLAAFRRHYFGHWRSQGIPVPLELAQHLVLGRSRTRGASGSSRTGTSGGRVGRWDLGGAERDHVGMDGKPHYLNGPHDHPERVLATLKGRSAAALTTTPSRWTSSTNRATAIATPSR